MYEDDTDLPSYMNPTEGMARPTVEAPTVEAPRVRPPRLHRKGVDAEGAFAPVVEIAEEKLPGSGQVLESLWDMANTPGVNKDAPELPPPSPELPAKFEPSGESNMMGWVWPIVGISVAAVGAYAGWQWWAKRRAKAPAKKPVRRTSKRRR